MLRSDDGIPAAIVAPAEAVAAAIVRLEREDAVALPFLGAAACAALLAEARALDYRTARPEVGEGARLVRQDFHICTHIPEASPLFALMRATTKTLQEGLAMIEPPPFAREFAINDLVVQRYAAGSAGISPHRDHRRYVGLVALLPLSGAGRFYVCDDRAGAKPRPLPAAPGDLILLRAPGLFGRTDRPFHALADIPTERYSIGMRQDETKPMP
ncbi:MAG: hypothetical protein AB7P52_17985 [Alphaproteobacteria bacterium]